MNVLVSTSSRFALAEDGSLWAPSAAAAYCFWARYLDAFDEVRLLARAMPFAEPPASWVQASGYRVTPAPLPCYIGPAAFAVALPKLRKVISVVLAQADAVILRIPCPIGELVRTSLVPGRPFGVEVIGDPHDVFAPGAVRHVLRPLFRKVLVQTVRKACSEACAVAYVTERSLRMRYQASESSFITSYADVDLDGSAMRQQRPNWDAQERAIKLVTVGSLEQPYKGTDLLIEALAICVAQGINAVLRVVGDGKSKHTLAALARRLMVSDRVLFVGHLIAARDVQAELDNADIFVLPSRAEGLPNALVEAMSRALPCIGSAVGGIPELLLPEDIVPVNDAWTLAKKIREIVSDPERMARMSRRNASVVLAYRSDLLRPRRAALYNHVRALTSAWQRKSA